jgi:hypothetical protein
MLAQLTIIYITIQTAEARRYLDLNLASQSVSDLPAQ